jgi:hypothetical protein
MLAASRPSSVDEAVNAPAALDLLGGDRETELLLERAGDRAATVCGCHPKAATISSTDAPFGSRSISISFACLPPARLGPTARPGLANTRPLAAI